MTIEIVWVKTGSQRPDHGGHGHGVWQRCTPRQEPSQCQEPRSPEAQAIDFPIDINISEPITWMILGYLHFDRNFHMVNHD